MISRLLKNLRNGTLINGVFMRRYFFHIQGKKRRRPYERRGFLRSREKKNK